MYACCNTADAEVTRRHPRTFTYNPRTHARHALVVDQATLLYFHHFLDASGRKIHDIEAILNDATPRGWGLLMIGVDMLTEVLGMTADSDTALTMHALHKAGMPTNREQCMSMPM